MSKSDDLISRQALCEYALNQKDKCVTPNDIMRFPSAQQDCTECEEYDSETKSCPKYCDVIRQTLAEAQPECTGRWIEYVEDGYVECPFCHSATNCDGNISELHFCFSCGARLEGEG